MDKLLENGVAVVTGAGNGNGRAIALGLAREGAAVGLLDIDEEAVMAVAAEITRLGGRALARASDVGDLQACRDFAKAVEEAFGPASILINNAGVLARDPVGSDGFEASWQKIFRVNVDGCINMVRAFHAQLRATRGTVVNIGSIASFRGSASAVAYTASKGAVLQMTRTLAAELGVDGIRVNGIAPGRIATAMTEGYRDEPAVKQPYIARTPLGRYGEPEDLVGPTLFLASPMAAYVSGVMLPVDGGYLAT
jgi:NAD(P)-dependent dehydrogenase (short-subunit alcohol dehydrogenase family)